MESCCDQTVDLLPPVGGVVYRKSGRPPHQDWPLLWQSQALIGEILRQMVSLDAFRELVTTAGIKEFNIGPEHEKGFRSNWNQCYWFSMLQVPLMAVVGSPAHITQLLICSQLEVNDEGLRLQQTWFSDGVGGVVAVSVYVGCNLLQQYRIDGEPIVMGLTPEATPWRPSWRRFVTKGFLDIRVPTRYDRERMVYPEGGPFEDPTSDASRMKAFWKETFDRVTRCCELTLKDRVGDRPTGGWPCKCNGYV